MYIGHVFGNVIATIKHPFFDGHKLMLVERLQAEQQDAEARYDIAVDLVQAGPGDTVLVLDEGSSTRGNCSMRNPTAPCEQSSSASSTISTCRGRGRGPALVRYEARARPRTRRLTERRICVKDQFLNLILVHGEEH